MESLQAQINSVQGGYLAARSSKKVSQVNEVEAEIMLQCLRIKEQVMGVRAQLASHLWSPKNINGCLRGSVDLYLQTFDAQIAKLRAKFEEDRKH